MDRKSVISSLFENLATRGMNKCIDEFNELNPDEKIKAIFKLKSLNDKLLAEFNIISKIVGNENAIPTINEQDKEY